KKSEVNDESEENHEDEDKKYKDKKDEGKKDKDIFLVDFDD
ncbi:16705_t:CDS:1, partial [Racocetra persica]